MASGRKSKKRPNLDYLEWLIDARSETNHTALWLLSLFESYPEQIHKSPFLTRALTLVAISFSLWRAAFLANRLGDVEVRMEDAQTFLRKMLAENSISFSHEIEWREWTFNYYTDNALLRLGELEDLWDELELGDLSPPKGKRTSKNRWYRLQKAFDVCVRLLANELETADTSKKSPTSAKAGAKRRKTKSGHLH